MADPKPKSKHTVVRADWQPTASQRRDSAKRGAPGQRLLGPLPLPRDAVNGEVTVDTVAVKLSNLDKVYFPSSGHTKRDLLDYSHDVAEFMLPHLLNRPATLKRFPQGIDRPWFFQKEAGEHMPPWVRTAPLPSKGERTYINYVLCNDCPTLLYLVNLGCIDHNVWMSRAATPDQPDFVLLDLDPGPDAGFDKVVRVAQAIRRVLEKYEILGFPKTSGATGMHILLPLAPGHSFAQSSRFAEIVLRLAAAEVPDLTTDVWSVADRPRDRVFLDFRQNAPGKTIPPPYSPRAYPGATVSTPLQWKELTRSLDPSRFTITNLRRRLEKYGDLASGNLPGAGHGQQLRLLLERMHQSDAPQKKRRAF